VAAERERSRGCRLDLPGGAAPCFEPGQSRAVQLVPSAGARRIYGFETKVMGALE
jgi:urease subunit beta